MPILLVAGAIEAFVSPSNIPGVAKALLGLSLAVALLAYIVAGGQRGSSPVLGETGGAGRDAKS